MAPRKNPLADTRTFEIVGRIQPETALEALESPTWALHGIVEDPGTGRPVTVLKHARQTQVLLVEEPEEPTVSIDNRRSGDPGNRPGPWPDA